MRLLADYPGIDGFLGTRGSLMLDVVFAAMLVMIPVMALSIAMARFGGHYGWHKRIQLVSGIALLVAVIAFELEVRLIGWTARARESPYWVDGAWNDWIDLALAVHLCFAIPTPLLWIVVIIQALRRFPSPPVPNDHSPRHRRWARLAAAVMLMTASTGWVFYWLAFAAS